MQAAIYDRYGRKIGEIQGARGRISRLGTLFMFGFIMFSIAFCFDWAGEKIYGNFHNTASSPIADRPTIQNHRPNKPSSSTHELPTPAAPAWLAGPAVPGSDTSLLQIKGHPIKLSGVIGMGSQYINQLQAFLAEHGNQVTCKPNNDAAFTCYVGKIDIGHIIVSNGAGRAEGARYLDEEERARAEQRGIWAGR